MKLREAIALTQFSHRADLGSLLNILGLVGSGVEIGSAAGDFARVILNKWRGKMLYMVDPWRAQDPSIYKEDQSIKNYPVWRLSCLDLARESGRATCVNLFSSEAAQYLPNDLDFVFIDGNHDFAHVTQDLNMWFPKIKSGGLICGHDFGTKHDSGWWCDVEEAVTKWMAIRGFEFVTTACSSWWMQVP